MPPFDLTRADRVGEYTVERHKKLDNALRDRDDRNASADHKRVLYRVVDSDDAERGDAEWCEECGVRGTFSTTCQDCS